MPNITDPFFVKLFEQLQEMRNDRIGAIIDGRSNVRGNEGLTLDAINTAIKYNKDVAVIETLNEVIELGLRIDYEQFGTRQNQSKEED